MAKKLMFQGTSSNVGKSILCTALCRIFCRKGLKTVPFKAQNMALNSYVTKWGDEIGRAQVAQAEAAGIEPIVQMNPVLLKPTGNQSSQVVLMGKPVGVFSAKEYHTQYSLTALDKVKESLAFLDANYDMIVIEGAGSPAEVNLKANDIVNMRIAKITQAPVMLIADIDRGGAIASIVGTLELLEPEERDLVKGIIINKFRGDINLLKPALDFIETKTGKKVVGVIPAIDNLDIDEEDSVALENKKAVANNDIQIAVLQTPKISNFTDFDALNYEPDVTVRYIGHGDMIGHPDLIILPGSKNTLADLDYLRTTGLADEIINLVIAGTPVIGICGGNQMLGTMLYDPEHMESDITEIEGLGLLPTETTMKHHKTTHQVKFDVDALTFLGHTYHGKDLKGYEIHMGDTVMTNDSATRCFSITSRSDKPVNVIDGFISGDGHVMGTYIHGIFDNDGIRRFIINALRIRKNLLPLDEVFHYWEHKNNAYNRLADIVESHIDMDYIESLLEND
ncbi:cobalamin biosynthesis protein CobQ [Veillonella montpellierensis DNF00314]|uniref:Cobyric acid synthase n=1 Tax=Veillonella montpellierensis DNF00314 TaxID=1401067 RepID=A0A096CRL8_9FIRM|nr:cobyric acid synthase [Veillonella montpellierensis]KGF47974.1 cobalamin biosynthesis protein CobQ [Veillonella montpellierensis DNF00314]